MIFAENCPYCNNRPKLIKVGDDRQYYINICSKCYKTPVKNCEARLTKLGAVLIWNKRVRELVMKEDVNGSNC